MKKKRPDDTIRKRICFLFLAVLVLFVGMAIFHHEKRKYALHDRVIEMEHFRSMQAGGSLQEETAELQKQSGLRKESCWHLLLRVLRRLFQRKCRRSMSCSRRRSGCTVIARNNMRCWKMRSVRYGMILSAFQ